jgi:hypothetical protein
MQPTILKLTQQAYESYKGTVKGNDHITHDQAARKLSRNVHYVSVREPAKVKRSWFDKVYTYGNLSIRVRFGKIVEVINDKGGGGKLDIDKKFYNRLSDLYDVESKFDLRHKRKLSKKRVHN